MCKSASCHIQAGFCQGARGWIAMRSLKFCCWLMLCLPILPGPQVFCSSNRTIVSYQGQCPGFCWVSPTSYQPCFRERVCPNSENLAVAKHLVNLQAQIAKKASAMMRCCAQQHLCRAWQMPTLGKQLCWFSRPWMLQLACVNSCLANYQMQQRREVPPLHAPM